MLIEIFMPPETTFFSKGLNEFLVGHVDFKILLQGIVESTLAVVRGNSGVPVHILDVEKFLNDVRWVFSDHAERITDLVVHA